MFFLDNNKDGKFTIQKFSHLSEIYLTKEKIYKRYEFRSQLQAHFTLLMWKVLICLSSKFVAEKARKSFLNG